MLPDLSPTHIILFVVLVLVVVGPKDLPMVLRKAGQWMAKIRGMANEFRASFDEMARQSELDELRKEVEAMRAAAGKPVADMKGQFAGFMEPLINVTAEDTPLVAADAVPAAEPEVGVMPPRGNVMKAEGAPEPEPTPKPAKAAKPKSATKVQGAKANSPKASAPKAADAKPKTVAKPKTAPKKAKAGGPAQ